MTTRKQQIEQKLREALQPTDLAVTDESYRHAGHEGNADGNGETHFIVRIRTPLFKGMSMIQQHRAVYAAISGIDYHALNIDSGSAE